MNEAPHTTTPTPPASRPAPSLDRVSPSARPVGRWVRRLGGAVAALALLWALALALPSAASAQSVPRLQGQVTDLTRQQVLAPGRARVDASLAQLLQQHDVQLWVLFVDTTGGRTATAFADEVARQNSLGANDALLVVAVGDRTDALWRSSSALARLTDRELEQVLSRRVEPLLAQGDFAGAVAAAAGGIAEVAGDGPANARPPAGQPERPPAGQTAPAPVGGGGLNLAPVLLLALVGVGGYALWRAAAGRKQQQRAVQEDGQEIERLWQEANTLLIATDETLRNAREEIGFAEAQFSPADVEPYRAALAGAADELKAAFEIRQRLDDDVPEDLPSRRRMVGEVVERARRAQALLEEQERRIEELRALEQTAPTVLATLPAELDAIEARLPEAERTLAALDRYAAASWASVRDNLVEARERIAQARASVADGQRALGQDDRAAAGRSVRGAQQAAAEAVHLIEATGGMAASLRQAEQGARPQVAAAAADVRAAQQALASGGRGELVGRLAQAEAALREAEGELAASKPDFMAVTRLAAQADAMADEVLAELKHEEERRERESRILAAHLQSAEASYRRAADFIAVRRQVVGSVARTRLTEAERHLDRAQALAVDDPRGALGEARRAQALADDAYREAQENLAAHGPYGQLAGFPRGAVIPIPIAIGGLMGGGFGGGGFGGGGSIGGSFGGGGGGSVGGRW